MSKPLWYLKWRERRLRKPRDYPDMATQLERYRKAKAELNSKELGANK